MLDFLGLTEVLMSSIRSSLSSLLKQFIFLELPKKSFLDAKVCKTGKYMYVAPSFNPNAEIRFRCKNLTNLPFFDWYSEYKIGKGELIPLNPEAPGSQIAYIRTSLLVAIQAIDLLSPQKDAEYLRRQILILENVLATSTDGFSILAHSEESSVLIKKTNNSTFSLSFVQFKKIKEEEFESYQLNRPFSLGLVGYKYDTTLDIVKEVLLPYSLISS